MKKTMMFLVAATFLMSSVCFGAKVDPVKIVVPRDSGRIVETYVSPKADAPVIAYVQDIHVNYEAQMAEADILEALVRDYGFDLMLLEARGAGNTADLKKYRTETANVRQKAADLLLSKAEISGVEYLDMVSDYNITLDGIEDMNLYKAETVDHASIADKTEDLAKLTQVLQNIVSNLKLHIYTKEMRDLDDKIAAYDKDEIGLIEYVKFLETAAKANNIDVKAMPNMSLFIESANQEGQINFPAVETERQVVFTAAEKALTGKTKEDLTAANLKFRTGDMTQAQFYTYLKDAAEVAKVDLTPHKNLSLYTKYITTYEKIDTTVLFKEIDQVVDKLKTAMIKTPEQKQLSKIDKGLGVLSDMVNTKLVPDEYNYYVQNKAEFDLKGWLAFLKTNSTNFKLTNPVPDDVSLITANLPLLEKFYATSYDRDAAFIKNIAASLTKYGKDRAVVITGGFHTANMKKLLKDNGYSYIVIAPRVDVVKDYSALYKDKMKFDLNYVNKTAKAPAATNAGNRAIVTKVAAGEETPIAAAVNQIRTEEGRGTPAEVRERVAIPEIQRQLDAATDPIVRARLSNLLTAYQQSPLGPEKGAWVGQTASDATAEALRNAQRTVEQVDPAIMAQVTAIMGTPAKPITIAVIDDDIMAAAVDTQGRHIMGPILIGDTVYVGRRDMDQRLRMFRGVWAHEIAEATGIHNGLTAEQAHARALDVEFAVRAQGITGQMPAVVLENIPRTALNDATIDAVVRDAEIVEAIAREHGQQGNYFEIQITQDLDKVEPNAVAAYRANLESIYGQDNVRLTYVKGEGQKIVTRRYDKKDRESRTLLGEHTQTIETPKNVPPFRVTGALTLGFIGCHIPAQAAGQSNADYLASIRPTLTMYNGQYRAITNNDVEGYAEAMGNPQLLPALMDRVRIATVQIPAPTVINVNAQLTDEIARQIFGKAA